MVICVAEFDGEGRQPETGTSVPTAASAAQTPDTEEDARLLEKYSKTFIGSYSHSLDSKGRLVVPLAFREQLGGRFCVAPSFDFQSIALYPTLQWARMHQRLERRGADTRIQRYIEWMDSLSYRDQECDGQGRVLLPAKIRQVILGDEKDVDITGANDHVRVMTCKASTQQFSDFLASLPDLLNAINDLEAKSSD